MMLTRSVWSLRLFVKQVHIVGAIRTKAILESIIVGAISAILSYSALVSPATVAAMAIRRKMPNAWFSGLIGWYTTFLVSGVAIAIAGVVFRIVYKRVVGSTRDQLGYR
jgi:hypothetical protein